MNPIRIGGPARPLPLTGLKPGLQRRHNARQAGHTEGSTAHVRHPANDLAPRRLAIFSMSLAIPRSLRLGPIAPVQGEADLQIIVVDHEADRPPAAPPSPGGAETPVAGRVVGPALPHSCKHWTTTGSSKSNLPPCASSRPNALALRECGRTAEALPPALSTPRRPSNPGRSPGRSDPYLGGNRTSKVEAALLAPSRVAKSGMAAGLLSFCRICHFLGRKSRAERMESLLLEFARIGIPSKC